MGASRQKRVESAARKLTEARCWFPRLKPSKQLKGKNRWLVPLADSQGAAFVEDVQTCMSALGFSDDVIADAISKHVKALRIRFETQGTLAVIVATELLYSWAESQADSKTDTRKKTPKNPDVKRLADLIRRDSDPAASMIDIALIFTDNDKKKADSLLRQVRRFGLLEN